jgi:methionyl-tRNA formyltransferase
VRRIEERLFYQPYQERGSAAVREILYGDHSLPERACFAELSTSAVNHVSTHALLRSLEPDLMITVGAPLLKPHIFTVPTHGTINVHFGIAPYYRGEETVFWPLYHGDEHQIGVTVHQIDRGIDTGPLLAQGFVSVEQGDTEWTLEAKAARLGADVLVDLLRTGALTPCWRPPRAGSGRQFNYSSRHLWHDARVYFRRRWLQEPLREFPEMVVNFCVPAHCAERTKTVS